MLYLILCIIIYIYSYGNKSLEYLKEYLEIEGDNQTIHEYIINDDTNINDICESIYSKLNNKDGIIIGFLGYPYSLRFMESYKKNSKTNTLNNEVIINDVTINDYIENYVYLIYLVGWFLYIHT